MIKLKIDNVILDLKSERRYEVDFVHAASNLSKLQINYVSLGGSRQACPGMLKENFETLWRYKVNFFHTTSYLIKLQIDHTFLDGHD